MIWNSELYDSSHRFVAQFGEGILSYLQAQADEAILDLGCGTGDLTQQIAALGANVIGIDSSAEMIEKAQSKFPELPFFQMDATSMRFDQSFDAIFSNAVLHWISQQDRLIERMYHCLKTGGRLVLEFGGKGNIQQITDCLRSVLLQKGYSDNAQVKVWYFPSIGEYASKLEAQGFQVFHAEHFDRPTPLKGDQGIKDWLSMFAEYFFKGISATEKETILTEVQEQLEPTHFQNGQWLADYKRIRILAVKK